MDTFGIRAAFGRDCAGAVMLLPDEDQPGPPGHSGYTPMAPADLRTVIGDMDLAPLGAAPEGGFRPSLALPGREDAELIEPVTVRSIKMGLI